MKAQAVREDDRALRVFRLGVDAEEFLGRGASSHTGSPRRSKGRIFGRPTAFSRARNRRAAAARWRRAARTSRRRRFVFHRRNLIAFSVKPPVIVRSASPARGFRIKLPVSNGRKLMAGPSRTSRVLDLSRVSRRPLGGQNSADLGAEVIKVERPGSGDDSRAFGPPWVKERTGATPGTRPITLGHRGKKSITVDISSPKARDRREIARISDVLHRELQVRAISRATASPTGPRKNQPPSSTARHRLRPDRPYRRAPPATTS